MSQSSRSEYTEEQIQQMLTEDPRIAEQGMTTIVRGETVILCGEVESADRRRLIERLVAERFPGTHIETDIAVTRAGTPEEAEDLS